MSTVSIVKRRKNIRVKGFDYSQPGGYFVTVCTAQKRCCLSMIRDASVQLLSIGKILEEVWNGIPEAFPAVKLDMHVTMPNHFHAILLLEPDASTEDTGRPPVTLGKVVGYLKMQTVKRARAQLAQPSLILWQQNYYEHIIRDDEDLMRIHQYIYDNPAKWHEDEYYADVTGESD